MKTNLIFLFLVFIGFAVGEIEKTSQEIVENEKDETSSLVHDQQQQQQQQLPGVCQWGVGKKYRAGYVEKCSCMKCTCLKIGKWDCVYHFAYCPYFYCGNQVYDPLKQVCCCGKSYNKKQNHNCCGYNYYDTKTSKCCNYFSVKAKKDHCPRDKI